MMVMGKKENWTEEEEEEEEGGGGGGGLQRDGRKFKIMKE